MSYQTERDDFIVRMATEGLPIYKTRKLLAYANTLHRLAEAQCNGDWPADNGERETAECQCGSYWAPSVLKHTRIDKVLTPKLCPDCRTVAHVKALLPQGFVAQFGGDPRGCVFKIKVPSGASNDWGRSGFLKVGSAFPARFRLLK